MRIVMTFVARGGSDLVRLMIDHHLRQGVDEFLITDPESSAELSNVLKEGLDSGVVRLRADSVDDEPPSRRIDDPRDAAEVPNVDVTWVLAAEAGDFWLARDRSRTIRHVLGDEPGDSGLIRVPVIELGSGLAAGSPAGVERRIDRDPVSSRQRTGTETGTETGTGAEAEGSESAAAAAVEVVHLDWRSASPPVATSVDAAEVEGLRAEIERVRARKSVRVADSVQHSIVRARALRHHGLVRLVRLPPTIMSRGRARLARRLALRPNIARRREVRRLLRAELPPAVISGTPTATALPLIMCLWNRPSRIDDMLASFARQTTDRELRVILWNNAIEDTEFYAGHIRDFTLHGALNSVELISNDVNIGGMARFVVARKLWEQGIRGPFLMVDDDQDIGETFVEDSLAGFESKSINAWWAFRNHGSHWSRSALAPGENADYGGTGGAAVDLAIVEDHNFFDVPVRYFMLEDQWMSHYARSRGWRITKSSAQITAVLEETNQYHALRELKDEFFRFLNP